MARVLLDLQDNPNLLLKASTKTHSTNSTQKCHVFEQPVTSKQHIVIIRHVVSIVYTLHHKKFQSCHTSASDSHSKKFQVQLRNEKYLVKVYNYGKTEN